MIYNKITEKPEHIGVSNRKKYKSKIIKVQSKFNKKFNKITEKLKRIRKSKKRKYKLKIIKKKSKSNKIK